MSDYLGQGVSGVMDLGLERGVFIYASAHGTFFIQGAKLIPEVSNGWRGPSSAYPITRQSRE